MEKQKNQNMVNIDDDFGVILTCAVRYSLGRETYMPRLIYDYTKPLLSFLSDKTLWCLERDIREHGGRETTDIKAYGADFDYQMWMEFLHEIQKEIRKRDEKL